MSSDTRLGSLSHLDLNRRPGVQVLGVYTEAARGNLDDGILSIVIEVLVQAPFAGVLEGAQLAGRHGKALVGVVGDRAVGHGTEHDRDIELQLS